MKLFFVVNDPAYFISHRMHIGLEALKLGHEVHVVAPGASLNVILDNGFKITSFRSRTIFCGLFFDKIIQGFKLCDWNAEIADKLSPLFASDWMFVLEFTGNKSPLAYQRNLDAQVRRYLNEKRFGLR